MTDKKDCESCETAGCAAKAKLPEETEKDFQDRQLLTSRMCQIKHKLIVLSGKGGVGKSTIAANLAATLSKTGKKVGLLDIDIHGPSIPKLFGLEGTPIKASENSIFPVTYNGNLKVMSIGLLINDRDQAVIWRGPMKYGVIKQFLKDVEWGSLDYLVIDSPPGTGDEPLSVIQLIENADGAVIVTSPQELALDDVRRSIKFCKTLNLPVLGIIENMSGFTCPHCGEVTSIFKSGGGERLADELKIPFLGKIPIDPEVVKGGDMGMLLAANNKNSVAAEAFMQVIKPLLNLDEE
ncbi:Mrp/NBP35 family ATP-binding protein [bacterium]|nr:Mrp/NBP35 family ATP-binding protein [bacterium]